MKLLSFALAIVMLASCSKSKSKEIEVVKTQLQQRYSPVELEGFEFKSTELSNREAYEYIYRLHMKDVDNYRAFPEVIGGILEKAKRFQTLQGQAKGDTVFYKVDYAKVATDTIHSGVYIVGAKGEIVYRRLFK